MSDLTRICNKNSIVKPITIATQQNSLVQNFLTKKQNITSKTSNLSSRVGRRIRAEFTVAKGRVGNIVQKKNLLKGKIPKKILSLRQHTHGNHATLFFDGSTAFKTMWTHIQSAKTRIWIEVYQLTPDTIGLTTLRLLTEASLRGVHVVLLYDGLGSYTLRDYHLRELTQANATVIQHSSPLDAVVSALKRNLSGKIGGVFWPWLGRNHRKLVIVDDDVAFCGGMNFGEDYCGKEVGGNGRFYDAHCLIRGPAHSHLVNGFLRSVKNASVHEWERLKTWVNKNKNRKIQSFRKVVGEGSVIQVLDSDFFHNKKDIQKALILSFKNAKSSSYVTTPYFLPPKPLQESILMASKRGVKVKLMTQGICRTPLISLASQHMYGKFLESGVEVYLMYDQELHAKLMVVDDHFCSVGTFNFDHLSFETNSEVNIAIWDQAYVKEIKTRLENDLGMCKKLTLEEWKSRPKWLKFVHHVAYVLCQMVFNVRFWTRDGESKKVFNTIKKDAIDNEKNI